MKKFVSSILVVFILLFSFGVSALADAEYQKNCGYYDDFNKEIEAATVNTEIIKLEKSFPNKTYSKVRLRETSKVNKMKCWVKTEGGTWMSDKHLIYPNNNKYTIYYYTDQTFPKNSYVVLWGEQANVNALKANGRFYCY